jgi:hypothetical protein
MRCKVLLLTLFAWLAIMATVCAAATRFVVTADNRDFQGFTGICGEIKKVPGGPGDFMISAGDMDPPAATLATVEKVFGPTFGWYPVEGNHDLEPVGPNKPTAGSKESPYLIFLHKYYADRLKGKVNPGPEGASETVYSFDAADVHVAVVNVYWTGGTEAASEAGGVGAGKKTAVGASQREWLKKDLAATKKPWKIVVGHEPAYPQVDKDFATGRHVDESLVRDKADRDAFWKVLEEANVAAYICGHTHRYSRFQPPGSKVWQLDAAQARGDTKNKSDGIDDWKYDTFFIVNATPDKLTFDVYRNLKKQGEFSVTDTLTLPQAAAPDASAKPPAPAAKTEAKPATN